MRTLTTTNPLIEMYSTRVTRDSCDIWTGSFIPRYIRWERTRITIRDIEKSRTRNVQLTSNMSSWENILPSARLGEYRNITIRNLEPNIEYEFIFEVFDGGRYYPQQQCWAKTLPAFLPKEGEKPFNILIGSCFYYREDNGRTARTYTKLYEDEFHQPDVKILLGDQIYADIEIPLHRMSTREIRDHFLAQYRISFYFLSNMLKRGSNFMLSDDHEFFNDFPFPPVLVPTLVSLATIPAYRRTWTLVARNCVRNVQAVEPVRIFTLGKDISFCIADFRTQRTTIRLMPDQSFDTIIEWINGLISPGVLACCQLLTSGFGDATDRNLSNFTRQYNRLVAAIANCPHDVVILTGDVHFGRISSVPKSTQNNSRLIEVVSSPMSNLSGVTGSFGLSTPDRNPTSFPAVPINNVPPREVRYHRESSVRGAKPPYFQSRSREHFTNISFNLNEDNRVRMRVNAWRIRSRVDSESLPLRDYQEYSVTLS